MLISPPLRERSFYNFRAQPFPIFVIWPKYAKHAILRDSEMATSFARPFAHANIPAPLRSSPFIVFVHDHFQYSLFGLNMLLVRFRAILRRQPFSRAQSHTLLSRPSRKRSIYNFRTRPHPIFVIWPKYATRAIPRDSKTATFFVRPIAHGNIPALPRAHLL